MAFPDRRDRRLAEAFAWALGDNAEAGLEAFRLLADWAGKLPGRVFGVEAARQIQALVRDAAEKASGGGKDGAVEKAAAFLCLLVARGFFRRAAVVSAETERLLEERRGVARALVESALPLGEADEARLVEALKRRTGAREVRLEKRAAPELGGGFRLRLGDEVIDASVRGMLRKMASGLAQGNE
jgi:F-type H+-transporting ATPase subunit delta